MPPKITCDCGTCSKCKHRAYMRDYYRRNAAKVRATAKASRARRIEAVRAYDRARGHRVYDRARENARTLIGKHKARGKITPQPCEVCGAKAEAHHDDYARPADVRWLCRDHHMALHRSVA